MGVSDVLGHVGCQDLSEDEAGFKVAKDAWFYLDLQSRRGLKNGGPCLKTKPWFILGVRLQEGMSRSQGWHLVVKIFQLALPNSHEHPNAIGISNDNGPPEFDMLLYIFYTILHVFQDTPGISCGMLAMRFSNLQLRLATFTVSWAKQANAWRVKRLVFCDSETAENQCNTHCSDLKFDII